MYKGKLGNLIGSILVPGAALVGGGAAESAYAAGSSQLPFNIYLTPNLSNVHAVLDPVTGVDKAAGALYSQPAGLVTFTNGDDVPVGSKLWLIAGLDKQVIGEIDIVAPGAYNFSGVGATYGIYGDNISTSLVDEGASDFEPLIVAAYVGDTYFKGYFSSGILVNGYDTTKKRNDIKIDSTMKISGINPVPAGLRLELPCNNNPFDFAPYDSLNPSVESSKYRQNLNGVARWDEDMSPLSSGWKLEFFDEFGQAVGLAWPDAATGNFRASIYGDDPLTTGLDEGMPFDTSFGSILATDPSGRVYSAYLPSPFLYAGDGSFPTMDITVVHTPEQGALTLLAAGSGLLLGRRRRAPESI